MSPPKARPNLYGLNESSGSRGGGLVDFGSLVHFGWSFTNCRGLEASIGFKRSPKAGIGFKRGLGAGIGFEGGLKEAMDRRLSQRKAINSAFLSQE